MSTGLPSPPRTPPGSPEPAGPRSRGARRGAGRRAQAAIGRARTGRWAPSRPSLAREIALAALAGVLLAIITSWPLVLHMGSRIAPDLGDPVRTAWEIAWVGHAMLHDPLHLFDSNAFYPHPLSLAFSDSLLGYGPAAFFGSGTVAALVRYNLLFLWAWSLCFVGAYLLARELGLRPARRRRRRPGLRLRALPRHRGGAPARDLLRRAGARAVPAVARLPALLAQARARRLAAVRLADQPRLHARPAVRLPAGAARAARARVLVARAPDPGPGVASAEERRPQPAPAGASSPRRSAPHRTPRRAARAGRSSPAGCWR